MKYYVEISVYKTGEGYQYSECIDSGHCKSLFDAKEYASFNNEWLNDDDDEWVDIVINFYNDEDDPMFDKPIHTSEYGHTICGKF